MKWDNVIEIDNIFENLHSKTLFLMSNSEDSLLLEDCEFVKDNNKKARIDFTSGVRDIVTKEQLATAKEVSDKASKIVKYIAESSGGFLEGLDCMIKSEESLNRKLRDWEDSSANGSFSSKILKTASESVHDVLRFTIIFDPKDLVFGFFKANDIMKKNKMCFVRVKNTFGAKGSYKGVNTYVLAKGEKYNYIFELQFHTKQSWEAKDKTHELYEIERNSQYSKGEREKAHLDQAAIFDSVNDPIHYQEIKNLDYLNGNDQVGVIDAI